MPQFRPRATGLARSLRNRSTDAERKLWRHLSRRQLNGHKFSRQMPVGPYICDFLCREHRLIVEVDGGQHCDSSSDVRRTEYLKQSGFKVLRFWNNEVLGNVEGVLATIAQTLDCPPPTPSRAREGLL